MRSLRPELSRRAVLGLAAGAVLSGCRPGERRSPVPATPDPDPGVAASVRADEAVLIATYDIAMSRFPVLSAALSPLREQHREHLAALPGPTASPMTSPTGSPVQPPADAVTALRSLRAAESAAAAARIADCLKTSARLAPLLASIGASEAAHAGALAAVRVPR